LNANTPVAITENQKIWQCNEPASRSSITSTMSINHALMLNPTVKLQERDTLKETTKLQELSYWAYRFTSLVSLYNDHTLLLEIGKSIKLFKSLDHLFNLIKHDLLTFKIETAFGLAQTPKAAHAISFSRPKNVHEKLINDLKNVAIEHLSIDNNTINKLHNCGFKTLSCIQAIPSAELGARFGKNLITYLDQLWGRQADPQLAVTEPETFHTSADFAEPIRNLAWIQQQLDRLLNDLAQFIKHRQLICHSFTWQFYHENNRLLETVTIGLSAKQNTQRTFQELSQLKLAETKLNWEFSRIELSSKQLTPTQLFNDDLFHPQANQQQFDQLIDKLSSRLGHSALFRVHPAPEHLPELANNRKHATESATKSQATYALKPLKDEPLWLLEHPQGLTQQAQQPLFEGPLTIIHGPNRISSHWWAKLQSRDYFIARQHNGRLLWIFFDRNHRNWKLHGFFA